MKLIHIMLGGFFGEDGYLDSQGMYSLAKQIKQAVPDAVIDVLPWDRYRDIADEIEKNQKDEDLNIGVGFSGGASRWTWINHERPKLRIDLMVLYDPSPHWQMYDINENVRKAVSYENDDPMFFGLGGGELKGPNVEIIHIAEEHAVVQFDQTLHTRTVDLVKAL